MPRVFDEPNFFYDIPLSITKVQTLLVYEEEQDRYSPTRCCIDELGMFLILYIGDGVSIDLVQALEVRPKRTANYLNASKNDINLLFDNSFCIEYGSDISETSTIYMIALTQEKAETFIKALKMLINNTRLINPSMNLLIAREFYRLRGFLRCIGKTHVKHLFESMRLGGKTTKYVHEELIKLNFVCERNPAVLNWDKLTFEKFQQFFIHCLKTWLEVVECHIMHAEKLKDSTFDEFEKFIKTYQSMEGVISKEEDAINIYYDTEDSRQNMDNGTFSQKAFHKYIFSEHMNILSVEYATSFQDMTQPMSHYFINSSHNTYLKGKQIMSISSVDMYRNILLSGCRCVEIDCWEDKDQLIVTHGKAMCTNITLYQVLLAIKETAFISSDYPVIISIENHLSSAGQLTMAKYFESIFGSNLLSQPLEEYPLKPGILFPSPQKLRRKILLKNKKLPLDKELSQSTKVETQKTNIRESISESHSQHVQKYSKRIPDTTQSQQSSKGSVESGKIENEGHDVIWSKEQEIKACKSLSTPIKNSIEDTIKLQPINKHSTATVDALKTSRSAESIGQSKFYDHSVSVKKVARIYEEKTLFSSERVSNSLKNTSVDKQKASTIEKISNKFKKENSYSAPALVDSECVRASTPYTEKTAKKFSKNQEEKSKKTNATEFPSPLIRQFAIEQNDEWQQFPKNEYESSFQYSPTQSLDSSSFEGYETNPHLSRMINYFKVGPANEFQKFDDFYYLKISSFNEINFEKVLKENPKQVSKHLINTIVRVYPKPTRLDSSNFNPKFFWDAGVQMAALNFQTADLGTQLNSTFFEINRRCGYVLKPDYLIRDKSYSCLDIQLDQRSDKYSISITVFSALLVTDPGKPDLYCQIETLGSYVELISKKIKSTPKQDVWPPIINFEGEKVAFGGILSKDYNFIRFSICDRNSLYAQRILNLKDIKKGYRYIPLRSPNNQQLPLSSLFVHINFLKSRD